MRSSQAGELADRRRGSAGPPTRSMRRTIAEVGPFRPTCVLLDIISETSGSPNTGDRAPAGAVAPADYGEVLVAANTASSFSAPGQGPSGSRYASEASRSTRRGRHVVRRVRRGPEVECDGAVHRDSSSRSSRRPGPHVSRVQIGLAPIALLPAIRRRSASRRTEGGWVTSARSGAGLFQTGNPGQGQVVSLAGPDGGGRTSGSC